MLLRGAGVLTEAARGRTAVAGFTAYNLETVQAIRAAAEATGAPVILQAGASGFRHGGWALAHLALAAAADSSARIGVHLDHSRDLEEIRACLDLGYTSVMVDGSHLPFRENVELTREAAELAHAAGAWVEGELGALAGDEDRSTDARSGAFTDPREAARFVEETGVDALAVAVGNVHGFTSTPVRLDFDRLAEIHASCPVPLVLHGASGLPPADREAALDRGVAKVNVNTELRQAFLAAVEEALPDDGHDLAGVLAAGRRAVERVAHRTALELAPTSPAPSSSLK